LTPKYSMQEVMSINIDATRTSLDNTHVVLRRLKIDLLTKRKSLLVFRFTLSIGSSSPDRANRHVMEFDQHVDDGAVADTKTRGNSNMVAAVVFWTTKQKPF
jgi:hypothetical protein